MRKTVWEEAGGGEKESGVWGWWFEGYLEGRIREEEEKCIKSLEFAEWGVESWWGGE